MVALISKKVNVFLGQKDIKKGDPFIKQTHFWINEKELQKLNELARISGRSMSSVVRGLINDSVVREMPPLEYHKLISELHRIGVNLNQIARIANSTGNVDRTMYMKEAVLLQRAVLEIRHAVELR